MELEKSSCAHWMTLTVDFLIKIIYRKPLFAIIISMWCIVFLSTNHASQVDTEENCIVEKTKKLYYVETVFCYFLTISHSTLNLMNLFASIRVLGATTVWSYEKLININGNCLKFWKAICSYMTYSNFFRSIFSPKCWRLLEYAPVFHRKSDLFLAPRIFIIRT